MTTAAATPQKTPRRNSAGLRRDLELLEVLGSAESVAAGGLGVNRLAQLVGRDKGQVSRTLATLADSGLAARDQSTLNYRLGYQLYALAARTLESRLVREATPYLRRVVTALHETTHLCVFRSGSVLTLTSETSEYAFRGLGWEGVSVAAWQTSAGRVLISDWNDADLRRWYEAHGNDAAVTGPVAPELVQTGNLPIVSDAGLRRVVTDADTFLTEIHRIRTHGYATVDEEFERGVVGVSAPVYDFRHNIIAAINVSAPKTRLGGHLEQAGRVAARVAAELSTQLGAHQAR